MIDATLLSPIPLLLLRLIRFGSPANCGGPAKNSTTARADTTSEITIMEAALPWGVPPAFADHGDGDR